MPRASAVLTGVRSVLVPGGLFVAEFGARQNIKRIIEAVERSLSQLNRESSFSNPWYFPTVSEFRTELESAGFIVESIESFERPTPLREGLAG